MRKPGETVRLSAPALGRLTVRTTFETCQIFLGGLALGYPPLRGAAGCERHLSPHAALSGRRPSDTDGHHPGGRHLHGADPMMGRERRGRDNSPACRLRCPSPPRSTGRGSAGHVHCHPPDERTECAEPAISAALGSKIRQHRRIRHATWIRRFCIAAGWSGRACDISRLAAARAVVVRISRGVGVRPAWRSCVTGGIRRR